MEDQEHWTLDKRIPVALIIALLGQFGVGVWAWATLSANVADLQSRNAATASQVEQLRVGRESNASRITALETRSISTDTKLDRIEDKLDRLIEAKKP